MRQGLDGGDFGRSGLGDGARVSTVKE